MGVDTSKYSRKSSKFLEMKYPVLLDYKQHVRMQKGQRKDH